MKKIAHFPILILARNAILYGSDESIFSQAKQWISSKARRLSGPTIPSMPTLYKIIGSNASIVKIEDTYKVMKIISKDIQQLYNEYERWRLYASEHADKPTKSILSNAHAYGNSIVDSDLGILQDARSFAMSQLDHWAYLTWNKMHATTQANRLRIVTKRAGPSAMPRKSTKER